MTPPLFKKYFAVFQKWFRFTPWISPISVKVIQNQITFSGTVSTLYNDCAGSARKRGSMVKNGTQDFLLEGSEQ